MRRDTCACGALKDSRARTCRACFEGEVPTRRVCTLCKIEKDISEFRIRTRAIPRPRSWCMECEAATSRATRQAKPKHERKLATRKWEAANPEKVRLQSIRRGIRSIGLGHLIDRLVPRILSERQCECCGKEVDRLRVDHCHTTGKFRGLICDKCNLGIGHFADNPSLLRAAADYLERGAT